MPKRHLPLRSARRLQFDKAHRPRAFRLHNGTMSLAYRNIFHVKMLERRGIFHIC